MKKTLLLLIIFWGISGVGEAQTPWMKLHPQVSWDYLKNWEKTHQWLTPGREGRSFFQVGRISQARKSLSEAITAGSNDGRSFYELGYCCDLQGDSDQAYAYYLKAVQLLLPQYPEHIYLFNSYYLLGKIHEERGEDQPAFQYYREALRLQPHSGALQLRLGLILRRQKKYRESLREIKQALRSDPNLPGGNYLLGLLHLELGETAPARKDFQQALTRGEEKSRAAYALGYLERREGHPSDAIRYYQQSLRIDPDQAQAHLALANIFYEEDKLDQARIHYTALSRKQPEVARWHYNLGVIYRGLEKPSESREEFKEAERLDPELKLKNNFPDQISAGERYYREGNLKDAASSFREILWEDPFSVAARYNLALTYSTQGQLGAARREYGRLLRIDPDYSPALLNLGILTYQKNRHSPRAAYLFRRYLQLNPRGEQRDLIRRYLHEIRGW